MTGRIYTPSSTTEDPDRYKKDGLHPLVLGDEVNHGRYRIIHKLGSGSYSTVWLCRDQKEEKYVSLKVLSADTPVDTKELRILTQLASSEIPGPVLGSAAEGLITPEDKPGLGDDGVHKGKQFVMHLLDHFVITGPNGDHTCLVNEVAGRRLSRKEGAKIGSLTQARQVGLQLALALDFLHNCYTSNILMQLSNFDSWSEDDIYEALGPPEKHKLRRLDGGERDQSAPAYTVKPANIAGLEAKLATERILLIDFGESFHHDEQPEEITTPAPYASPEIVFGAPITPAIDKWAFACVVYEIAADHSLFKMIFGWFNDTLKDQVAMLGKPPQAMWENWKNRGKYFDEDGTPKDPEGRRLKVEPYDLEQRVRNIGRPLSERGLATQPQGPLEPGLLELYDLLKRLLVYEPEKRASFGSIINHPFFQARSPASL